MDASGAFEDFDPFYNPAHRDSDELLQENFISMAEKNTKEVEAAHKIQELFLYGMPAEFVFEICEELDLCDKVKFQTVELFSRFLPRHLEELRSLVSNADSSASEKEADWQKIVQRVEGQLMLRVVSCAQVVAKSLSYAKKVTPRRIQQVLHMMGKDYSTNSICQSELRVLTTLNYSVNVSSPFEFVLTVLEILGRRNPRPQLPLQQYQMVSSDLLMLVYLKNDEIYHLLLSLSIDPPEKTLEQIKADKLLAAVGVIATAAFIFDPNHVLLVREELACISRYPCEDIDAFKKALLQVVHSSSHQGSADSSGGSPTPQEGESHPPDLGHQHQQGPSSSVSVNQPQQRPAVRNFMIDGILSPPQPLDEPQQRPAVRNFMIDGILSPPQPLDEPQQRPAVRNFMIDGILSPPEPLDQPQQRPAVRNFMIDGILSPPEPLDEPQQRPAVRNFMIDGILSPPEPLDEPQQRPAVRNFMIDGILSPPQPLDEPQQRPAVRNFMIDGILSPPQPLDEPQQRPAVRNLMIDGILSPPQPLDEPQQRPAVRNFMIDGILSPPQPLDQPQQRPAVRNFMIDGILSPPQPLDQPQQRPAVRNFMINGILSPPQPLDEPQQRPAVRNFMIDGILSPPEPLDEPQQRPAVRNFMIDGILSPPQPLDQPQKRPAAVRCFLPDGIMSIPQPLDQPQQCASRGFMIEDILSSSVYANCTTPSHTPEC